MNISGYKTKSITAFLVLLLSFFFSFTACEQPNPGNHENYRKGNGDDPPSPDKIVAISVYPDNEITFYDDFALFSTTIISSSSDRSIGAFDISLSFDAGLLSFESVYSRQFLPDVAKSPGKITIRSQAGAIVPGDNPELFNVTWKATRTGITDVTLTVNSFEDTGGRPIETLRSFSETITIVKRKGAISFEGIQYMKKDTEFESMVYIDTAGMIIKEYDIDVIYDAAKLTPQIPVGKNQSIGAGSNGFIDTVSEEPGKINVKGSNSNGMGPGAKLEFLIADWTASDSGRTLISIDINRIVTTDNVFVKPDVRPSAISIYSDNKKPTVDVWIEPAVQTVSNGSHFITSVYLNTTGYLLAAYGIDIRYDPSVFSLDTGKAGGKGVEAGSNGFLAVSYDKNGVLSTAGFQVTPSLPNPRLELLKIYWIAKSITPSSEIMLDVRSLTDPRTKPIDKIRITNGTVIVTE